MADIRTKALGRTKFDYFREKMGMIKIHFNNKNGHDVAVKMQFWEEVPAASWM